jgi:hypothetical protein
MFNIKYIECIGPFNAMLLIVLCLPHWSFAQNTFSTRNNIVYGTWFQTVQVLESGHYMVLGSTVHEAGQVYSEPFSALYNGAGDLDSYQLFGDSTQTTAAQYHTMSYVQDIYLQQGYSLRNDIPCALLYWFDADGDTIRSKELFSPFLGTGQWGDSFINPLYSILMPDSTVYLSTTIAQPGTGNDICIWRLDAQGDELWHYIHATDGDPETCYSILPTQEGVVCSFFEGINANAFESFLKLVFFDSQGNIYNVLDDSLWNNFSVGIRAMIDNGGWVCAGSITEEVDLNSRACLWKIGYNGELVWSCNIGEYPIMSNGSYSLSNVVKTTDGNYVVTDDFFVSNEDDFSSFARVSKVGSDGVFHWSQLFQFIDTEFDMNRAYDLKATPDGGVVFCGESTDLDTSSPTYESPSQRGWIVKLDECGCLVPGCNELCITEGVDDMHLPKFLLGPNPTAANLHVFIPSMPTPGHREIRIYNLMGKLVTSFATPEGETTYIVDMTGFADGHYIVGLFEDNRLVYSEKVVKLI